APLCLSATHVGWGCIRLEPVWIQTGEAAALAAVQSMERKRSLADVSVEALQEDLLQRGSMLAFLNDVQDLSVQDHAFLQFAALKGCFPAYDARPQEPLTLGEAELWASSLCPSERARRIHALAGSVHS